MPRLSTGIRNSTAQEIATTGLPQFDIWPVNFESYLTPNLIPMCGQPSGILLFQIECGAIQLYISTGTVLRNAVHQFRRLLLPTLPTSDSLATSLRIIIKLHFFYDLRQIVVASKMFLRQQHNSSTRAV
jgi:hypothetical protein